MVASAQRARGPSGGGAPAPGFGRAGAAVGALRARTAPAELAAGPRGREGRDRRRIVVGRAAAAMVRGDLCAPAGGLGGGRRGGSDARAARRLDHAGDPGDQAGRRAVRGRQRGDAGLCGGDRGPPLWRARRPAGRGGVGPVAQAVIIRAAANTNRTRLTGVCMLALVFPGQGSQSVGMLGELAGQHPLVRGTFEEASAALGYDLWQLVAGGPAEQLNRTEYTQPAMLTAGIATWRLWREQGGAAPALVAGHSPGELTARVGAETLALLPGVRLVRERGRYMQEAVPRGGGAMAAILGLDDAAVEAACAEAAQGDVVEAVNYNAPGQVVIAGQAGAVERAMAAAKARGAKRALTLPVSVPAHSSLMRSAGERLQERLGDLVLRPPAL